MSKHVFHHHQFNFPYHDISFPGQHSEEKILFATREGRIMFIIRSIFIALVIIGLLIGRGLIYDPVRTFLPSQAQIYSSISALIILLIALLGIWWVYTLWKKSVFIITTRRLTKFIYTTPWNRYQLSLGLDKVVDTGAYQKGYFQAMSGLGYFVARSAAGNIKNFKIINISFAEDLHNYVNKLLFTFNREKHLLNNFRPFIPHLKGQARIDYVKTVTPEYYQDK